MPFWVGQESLTNLQWLLKAAVLFLYLLLFTKLMGQREIGRLTLIDFIVAVTIGSVVGGTLSSSTAGLKGPMIAVATLAGLEIFISVLGLKSPKLRRVFEEEPIVLVQNGVLLENTLKKTRINLDDLLSQLRQKGYFYLNQVEFAVLEPNGKISVLPKSQNRPVTPNDLKIETNYEGYPSVVIEDGDVRSENLSRMSLSLKWLQEELEKNNVSSPKDVLIAILDTQGRLYYSLKNRASERLSFR